MKQEQETTTLDEELDQLGPGDDPLEVFQNAGRREVQDHFVSKFPFPSFRDGQEAAIRKISDAFHQGYRYVVLDAPTGAGKSGINTTILRGFRNGFYTTPQNSLIDQIEEDQFISEYFDPLKGKSNYGCQYQECYDGEDDIPHRADVCVNSREGEGTTQFMCCDAGIVHQFISDPIQSPVSDQDHMENLLSQSTTCDYPKAVWRARTGSYMLTNTFLYSIAPFLKTRDLTVIDESHNLEQILFNYCDISINSNQVPFYDQIEDDVPTDDPEPEKVMEFITTELASEVNSRLDSEDWVHTTDTSEVRDVERLEKKIRIVSKLDEDFLVETYEDNDSVEGVKLKPVYCGNFFQRFINHKSQAFLFSSATFQNADTMLGNLGVHSDDIKVVSMDSQFPLENRPIYFRDVTDLRQKNFENGDYRKIAEEIEDIAQKHEGEKGIIHSVSYNRMRKIKRHLDRTSVSDRIMNHSKRDSDEKLEEFQRMDDDTIFLSVAKEQGVDLEEDQARFNIVSKMPNAYMGDERISHRVWENDEWTWYNGMTATRLAQMYGRTTRSAEDHSSTYILDSSFRDFYRQNHYLLPDWFCDAVDRSHPRLRST